MAWVIAQWDVGGRGGAGIAGARSESDGPTDGSSRSAFWFASAVRDRSEDLQGLGDNMPRWGMVIDLNKCTGCQACETACAMENNIPIISEDQTEMGRGMSWMKVLTEVSGEFPHTEAHFVPRPCMQCDNPPCTKVCPVNATQLAEDGIVAQIYARCIGCRYCANACPYSVKYFNYYEPQ